MKTITVSIKLAACLIVIHSFFGTSVAAAKPNKAKKIVTIVLKPEAKKKKLSKKKGSSSAMLVSVNYAPSAAENIEVEPIDTNQKTSHLGIKKAKKKKSISRSVASVGADATNRIGMAMPEKIVLPEAEPVQRHQLQTYMKSMTTDDAMDLDSELEDSL